MAVAAASPALSVPPPAAEGAILLRAENVKKTYRDGDRSLEVLRGASLTVRRGEYVSIIGQSGSGKSTLLHLLGALDKATSGEIALEGRDFAKLSAAELNRLRAEKVGFIYQFHHLLPEFTALENVFMPGMVARRPTAELIRRAGELLTRMGLAERMEHRPSRLSGGEQQRVALARALMNDPVLVLADEPTGDLDQKTGREVMDIVLSMTVGQGKSLVMVTHDPALAAVAHRRYRLDSGQIAEA